jgi:hypothetical protein
MRSYVDPIIDFIFAVTDSRRPKAIRMAAGPAGAPPKKLLPQPVRFRSETLATQRLSFSMLARARPRRRASDFLPGKNDDSLGRTAHEHVCRASRGTGSDPSKNEEAPVAVVHQQIPTREASRSRTREPRWPDEFSQWPPQDPATSNHPDRLTATGIPAPAPGPWRNRARRVTRASSHVQTRAPFAACSRPWATARPQSGSCGASCGASCRASQRGHLRLSGPY